MTGLRRPGHAGIPALLGLLPLLLALLLPACTGDTARGSGAFDVAAEVSEVISTVITVEWTVDLSEPDAAYVEFGPEETYGRTAPADLTGEPPYRTVLLGMKPSTEAHYRVVAEAGGETFTSDPGTISTGTAPGGLPEFTAEALGEVEDGYLVTSLFASSPAAVILDRDGDYVWWYEAPSEDFQVSRAHLSADRQHVVFWSVNLYNTPPGDTPQKLIRVSLDGTDVVSRTVEEGHHDFTVMPDDGITYIEYDVQDGVDGDRLIEVSPDGEEREIWSVWEDFDSGGAGGPGTTFAHFNAIDYYEDEDALYVSSLGLECLLKVDRGSGELLWSMGGDESDFVLDGGNTDFFERNHQFERLDDSIVMFVNGSEQTYCSDVREYAYDEDSFEAELVWSYTPDPCVFSFSLGDVARMDSGNTLVTFSAQGQIDEVDENGDLLWRMNAGLGGAVGYATFLRDLYTD